MRTVEDLKIKEVLNEEFQNIFMDQRDELRRDADVTKPQSIDKFQFIEVKKFISYITNNLPSISSSKSSVPETLFSSTVTSNFDFASGSKLFP